MTVKGAEIALEGLRRLVAVDLLLAERFLEEDRIGELGEHLEQTVEDVRALDVEIQAHVRVRRNPRRRPGRRRRPRSRATATGGVAARAANTPAATCPRCGWTGRNLHGLEVHFGRAHRAEGEAKP